MEDLTVSFIHEDNLDSFMNQLADAKEAFILHQFEMRGYSKQDVFNLTFQERLKGTQYTLRNAGTNQIEYHLDGEPLFGILETYDSQAGQIGLEVVELSK